MRRKRVVGFTNRAFPRSSLDFSVGKIDGRCNYPDEIYEFPLTSIRCLGTSRNVRHPDIKKKYASMSIYRDIMCLFFGGATAPPPLTLRNALFTVFTFACDSKLIA